MSKLREDIHTSTKPSCSGPITAQKIWENSQRITQPKNYAPRQKVCPVARADTQKDMKVNFQGFQNISFNLSSAIGPIYIGI